MRAIYCDRLHFEQVTGKGNSRRESFATYRESDESRLVIPAGKIAIHDRDFVDILNNAGVDTVKSLLVRDSTIRGYSIRRQSNFSRDR